MVRAESMGMAKPMFWPPRPATAVLMPMTWPLLLARGPPELPGLMAASVWIMPVRVSSDRLRADTMPRVTVGSPRRPRALPMATTSSPTLTAADDPSSATASPEAPVICSRAMSLPLSAPTRVAARDWLWPAG